MIVMVMLLLRCFIFISIFEDIETGRESDDRHAALLDGALLIWRVYFGNGEPLTILEGGEFEGQNCELFRILL